MSFRRLGSLFLALSLLLAATAGVAGHDHVGHVERAGTDCAVDHDSRHHATPLSSVPELRAAGEQHQHQCLACHHGSQRTLLVAFDAVFGPALWQAPASELRPTPRSSISWTGRTLRGPPVA